MQADFNQPVGTNLTSLGRKSWTAYIGVCVASLFLFVIVVPTIWSMSAMVGVIVLFLSVCGIAYKVMELRSYHLFSDEMGVWLYSGVLPWNKGVRGVKWRDLDDATYTRSLGGWLLKSYSLRIGHRFTRSNELILKDIGRGDRAVMTINQQLQELARANRLN